MRRDILELASDLARRGQPFALATVVARTPPISAQVGDTALVTPDGGFRGWVGGSCTRPTVIAQALEALADGRPRLVGLDPAPETRRRPGLTVFPMTCHSGGSVEIHIQPMLPPPGLVVYGVSPTARALVRLGKAMGYGVTVVDATAEAGDFPDADLVLTDPGAPPLGAGQGPGRLYAVVATQGQWDEEAVAAALAQSPTYIGVMASSRRFGEMRALLAEQVAGTPSEPALGRIKNPAGLDLGAELPEEIALSILAEIVKDRRAAVAAPAADRVGEGELRSPEPVAGGHGDPPRVPIKSVGEGALRSPEPVDVRDPVCGMMVRIAGAAHRARHEGRDFFFCCAGCRQRFLAGPERYLAAGAAP